MWLDISKQYKLSAIAVGLISFFLVLGPTRILGIGGSFDWPDGDLPQHVAGAYAYLDSKWSFPIFSIDTLNTPVGTNAIFTDSAPAAGLVAKIVYSMTGLRFNYLGAWYFVSWMAQAVSAAYLVSKLGARSPIAAAGAAFFAVFFPAYLFVNGNGQIPLGSHFIIIASLAMAISAPDRVSHTKIILWALLVGLAIWTHVYLFAMAFSIMVASVGDGILNKRINWMRGFAGVLGTLMFAILMAYIGGYFTTTTGGASDGYGFYAANLFTFFDPQYSSLTDRRGYTGPVGHYEGYTYLGVSGLILLVSALIIKPLSPVRFCGRNPFLVITLTLMALYAVSNKIWAGESLLYKTPFDLDFPPFTIFRASGRFMLPLGYILVLGAFAVWIEWIIRQRRVIAVSALSVLIVAHLVDTGLLRRIADRGVVAQKREDLVAAIELADRIKQLPENGCLTDVSQIRTSYAIMWMAARAGRSLNTAYLARTAAPTSCSTEADLDPDALNIVLPNGRVAVGRDCFAADGVALCGSKADIVAQKLNLPRFEGAPSCPTEVDFSREGAPVWLAGISVAEAFGRWSDGRLARIVCSIKPGNYVIKLKVAGYSEEEFQDVAIKVNSASPLEKKLDGRHQILTLPAKVDGSGRLLIEFDIKHPIAPVKQGLSADVRELGVAFISMSIGATSADFE
jgi:hypothetical protein